MTREHASFGERDSKDKQTTSGARDLGSSSQTAEELSQPLKSASSTPQSGIGSMLMSRRGDVMALQRHVGNQAVLDLLARRVESSFVPTHGELQRDGDPPRPTNGTSAAAVTANATAASVQRIGLPGLDPLPVQQVVDAVELTLWLVQKQTAAELRQTRLDLDAVADGGSYALPLHTVTMDAQQRTRLKEAVRHHVMERVAEVRAALKPQLESAADAPARRAIQDQMRDAARPFLDELRDPAQPGSRFEHPSTDVQNAVLAALELDGEGHAEAELADQQAHGAAGPRERARQVGNLPEGAWCGAFTYTQQHEAGLSAEAREAMHATGPNLGIDAFLDYQSQLRVIWTGTEWKHVREYHSDRGSLRELVRLPQTPTPVTPGSVYAPEGLDIRPGDIVLIDNAKGTFADHIAQCRSYDASTGQLETIAGNERGGAGQVAASAQPRDLNANPRAQTVGEHDSKPSRVYAYGRFSIVDYEVHTYLNRMPHDPTSLTG